MARPRCSALAASVLLAILASGAGASAQPRVEGLEEPKRSLADRVGASRGEALLDERDEEARLRGLERLGRSEAKEALETLVEAMSAGRAARNDPRARLVGVRMLARHVGEDDDVPQTLAGVLNDVQAGSPESPLEQLSRATAAMALAASGRDDALVPLVTAVIGGGRTGELARAALLAHRPASLGPLGKSYPDMSPRVLELLGDLGDPRAIGVLRKQLRGDDLAIQRTAAVALAKLGDGTPVAIALKWLEEQGDEALAGRIAAAEVLVVLDAPGAAKAVADMLGRAKTRAIGLRLASLSLSPALVPTLEAVISAKVTSAERARAASLLAQMGTDEAMRVLVPLLASPELATVAALGLAKSPTAVASSALARALNESDAGPPRRLALRAAIVRELVGHPPVPGLRSALSRASASESPADRAVAAFGQVALGVRSVSDVGRTEHPEVRAAARRGALAVGPEALQELRPALAALSAQSDVSPLERAELAVALLVVAEREGERVATSVLARWAEESSVVAPLAAYRLAALDSGPYRSRLRALLGGTDPAVRAHVALGLADSPEADATALLADRYRFETDPSVRAAVIRALSRRSDKLRHHTLAMAGVLDPDPTVRALARSAQGGRRHATALSAAGDDFAWVTLRPNASEADNERRRAALLLRGDGLALPAVSDPDGVLLVGGVASTDDLELRLQPGE